MKKYFLLIFLSIFLFNCALNDGDAIPDNAQFHGEYKIIRIYKHGTRPNTSGGTESFTEELTNTCNANSTLTIPQNEQSFNLIEYELDTNNNCQIISNKNGVFTELAYLFSAPYAFIEFANDNSIIEFAGTTINGATRKTDRFIIKYKISDDVNLNYVFYRTH